MRKILSIILVSALFISIQGCNALHGGPELFTVSPQRQEISAEKQTISFDVDCDYTWSAKLSQGSWASIAKTTSIKTGTLGMVEIDVTANEDENERIDTLIVTSGKKELRAVIRQLGIGSVISTGHVVITEKDGAEFTVNATKTWVATMSDDGSGAEPSWFSISPNYALAGETVVKVTPKEPNLNKGDRDAYIKITIGDLNCLVTVTQKQTDAILLSEERVELGNGESTFDIVLKTNIDCNVQIDEGSRNWLSVADTKTLDQSTVTFKAKANPEESSRTATVTFSGNGVSETVSVYQAEKDILVLSSNSGQIGSDGGLLEISLRSNIEYEVLLPDNPTWIMQTATKALSTYVRSFFVHANTSYDSRSTRIIFKDVNSSLQQEFTLTQHQKNALIIDSDALEVDKFGEAFDVKVQANVDLNVVIPSGSEWLHRIESKGLTTSVLSFYADETTLNDPRTGHIIIRSADDQSLADTLTVTQGARDYIEVSPSEASIRFFGGNLTADIKANVSYTTMIEGGDGWISEDNDGISIQDTKRYIISENVSRLSREALVIFKGIDTKACDTILVRQEARPEGFVDVAIPAIYNMSGRNWTLIPGVSQAAIIDFESHYSFRIIYPSEQAAIEVRNIQWNFTVGENVLLDTYILEKGMFRHDVITATVIQIRDNLAYLEGTDSEQFIIPNKNIL